MEDRLKVVVGAHIVLRRGNKILLARRFNTGFSDGYYNFPCGQLDPNEDITDAIIREAKEEIGAIINKDDLVVIAITHWKAKKQSINFFYECHKWNGDIKNEEPNKCDDVSWFDIDEIPELITKQSRLVIDNIRCGNQLCIIEDEDDI